MANAAIKQKPDPIYDPKKEILDKLGDLSGVRVAQNEVLLAIYMRPARSAGGLYLTDNDRKEDRYQGKVGLVVKIGEACRFLRLSQDGARTFGIEVKLHDWVVVRPSDTWTMDVNTDPKAAYIEDFVPCRLIYDDHVRLVIDAPGMIW